MNTPANLSLKNTLFEGGVQARWRRIDNATFYEYQFVTGISSAMPPCCSPASFKTFRAC